MMLAADQKLPAWRRRLLAVEFISLIVLQLIAFSAAFAKPAPVVPAGRAFTCTAIAVWDGDGPIWCREGPRLRIAAIATRELDGSCRRGHPCPAASGRAARDGLVQLLGGPAGTMPHGHIRVLPAALACRSSGPDGYGRTLARCTRQGDDLGRAMIRAGLALPWDFLPR